jgi:hypothetical protein
MQVFVAKAINYTDDATYAAFVANAPNGEFGVFDANGALHTDAITALEEFYFAIRTSGGVKKSPTYKLSMISPNKRTYVAPVKEVATIGWSGTGGALNNPTIAVGQNFGFRIIETTEGNEPYPIWTYDYQAKASDTINDVIEQLAKKVNDRYDLMYRQNEPLVSAKVKAVGTYGNYALTGTTPTLTFTQGSNIVTLGGTTPTSDIAVGDYLSVDTAATPSNSVGDVYKVVAVDTVALTITLNRVYTGATIVMSEAQAEGTRLKKVTSITALGLEFTALDFGTHFRTAVYGNLVDADMSIITVYNPGNGTYDDVAAAEREGQTFNGETTKNTEFADRWGKNDTFSVAGETYDIYNFPYIKSEAALAPDSRHFHNGHVMVAAAKSAGNVGATLNTLFGL